MPAYKGPKRPAVVWVRDAALSETDVFEKGLIVSDDPNQARAGRCPARAAGEQRRRARLARARLHADAARGRDACSLLPRR